ncbi:MAG: DNA repair protein RecO [Candidatus Hinthialibacter antarcticus]|nr:DNA repair protein RecO [Candidatus Hinthialibacter antarcticus]
MPLIHTEAVVLRRRRMRDSDAIITLFAKECGKIAVSAKSVMKTTSRSAGVTQSFNRLHAILYAKNRDQEIWTLTQVSLVESYNTLQTDLNKMAFASCLAEWVDFLSHDFESNLAVWDLVLQAFARWNQNAASKEDLIFYQWRLLRYAGLHPNLSGAVEGKTHIYNAAEGRLTASDSKIENGVVMHAGSIMALNNLASSKEPPSLRLSQQQQVEIQRLIHSHLEFHIGRRSRSSLFLDRLLREGAEKPQPAPSMEKEAL